MMCGDGGWVPEYPPVAGQPSYVASTLRSDNPVVIKYELHEIRLGEQQQRPQVFSLDEGP